MSEFLRTLSGWFFAQGDPRTAAVLRIAFCGLYLAVLWDFHPVMDLLFGHAGLLGTLEAYPFDLSGPQYLLFQHDSPLELEVFFWGSVLVATCGLLGLFTRISLALTFVSMVLFQERGPYMIFGADLVMRCVGLWILFLDSGSVWSLDARRSGRSVPTSVEHWPVKAIQIQIALVYLVTGILKLQTDPWQDGHAVYFAIQVGNVWKGRPDAFILDFPWVLVAMNYVTLLTELCVPFMLFYRPLRFWAFAAVFMMHSGIDLFMSIRFFSAAMYVGLLAFLDHGDWNGWMERIQVARFSFPPVWRRGFEPGRLSPVVSRRRRRWPSGA